MATAIYKNAMAKGYLDSSRSDCASPYAKGITVPQAPDAPPPVVLSICSGPVRGGFVRLRKPHIRLGRGADNDLVFLEDASVSRHHACISWRAPHWVLEDNRSKNGTYIDRRGTVVRLNHLESLCRGQRFWLGTTEVQFDWYETETPNDASDTTAVKVVDGLPHVLRIRRSPRQLKATLTEHGRGVYMEECDCRDADLASLERRVQRLAGRVGHEPRSGRSDTVFSAIADVGRELAERFVPPSLLERLGACGSTLALDLDLRLAAIPWELLDIRGVPLGIVRPVERTIGPTYAAAAPMPETPRCLIISNPTSDLDGVQQGAESLFECLRREHPSLDIQYLARNRATRGEVMRGLGAADIVYFAGHATFDANDLRATGWRLADGILPPWVFRRLERRPWLVFANACESGRFAMEQSAVSTAGVPKIDTPDFGARHFVGTLWPAPVEPSRIIAENFFDRMFSGSSPAEALRYARHAAHVRDTDPYTAWTAYVAYTHAA